MNFAALDVSEVTINMCINCSFVNVNVDLYSA